jgi:hypothetical protein
MIKSSKKNHSVLAAIAIICMFVFSCTSITKTDIISLAKKTLAEPTFSSDGGSVNYGTVIKFGYSPSDAQLYYTTDGSEPDIDGDSELYNPNKGIELTESCTIKARLYHSNYNPSLVVENRFIIELAKPIISPASSEITTAELVTLSHTLAGTDIYYTLDGTNPSDDMDEYEAPFNITQSGWVILKAIAVKGSLKSKVAEQVFNVRDADGVYLNSLEVKAANGTNYLTNFSMLQNEYKITVPYTVDTVTVDGKSSSGIIGGT